jgi:hypothetical protein
MSGFGRVALWALIGGLLIPLGAVVGGVAASVWSSGRSVGENLLAVVWKVVKPNWI